MDSGTCNTAMDFSFYGGAGSLWSGLGGKMIVSVGLAVFTIGIISGSLLAIVAAKKTIPHKSVEEEEDEDFVKIDDMSGFVRVSKPKHLSRFLYPNPVTLLSAEHSEGGFDGDSDGDSDGGHCQTGRSNVMTLTWLTAVDNGGRFIAAIDKRRFTSSVLGLNDYRTSEIERAFFVLSVPVAGMEETILKIGSTHGSFGTDKFDEVGCKKVRISGWGGLAGVSGCCCFLKCQILSVSNSAGHDTNIIEAKIVDARVKEDYWHKPKENSEEASIFCSAEGCEEILTFFGSGKFGKVSGFTL